MARSGDWITPRLWGDPWFEKPVLLYWMTGAAFRLGLGEDMAPRLPVALASVAFLIFFFWILRREFGDAPAWLGTAILATSAGWLGFSHTGVMDLPMSAAFSAAMLLSLRWLETGKREELIPAAALLGAAVLAKGLVALVLALPLAVLGRKRATDWLRPGVLGVFLAVAAPWYVLCYLRNGTRFVEVFFLQHHIQRFASCALQHRQPIWYFFPVLLAAMFPWTPTVFLLFRRSLYVDRRRRFLLWWLVFGLVFFSFSANKLPGYILPLVPAGAVLAGLALSEHKCARWMLVVSALLLGLLAPLARVLPQALAVGLLRSRWPAPHWSWALPTLVAFIAWKLDPRRAVLLLSTAIAVGVLYLKFEALHEVDQYASARPIWREIAGRADQVCIEQMHRSWRYGLNYYSRAPLPACDQAPRPLRIWQQPGRKWAIR